MRTLLSAALAAAISLTALPAFTNPAKADLAAEAIERVKALRQGEMSRLLFHKKAKAAIKVPFQDRDGNPTTVDAFKGKVVVLNFWATWCPPCRHEMPSLDRLQAKLGGDDFKVLPVSLDRQGLEKVDAFFSQIKAENLPVYLDENNKFAVANRAIGLPMTLILDRQGREIGRLAGPAEWDSADAVSVLSAVVKETAEAPVSN
ncbi:TlpA disulfide reductase family protein [Coralliovum pocilloporae]|uniref:TlpA disulfide reductase family protein n=1 Tax=Coralliovum pocilloporae TaxID=3066369 RepID=UPI003307515A